MKTGWNYNERSEARSAAREEAREAARAIGEAMDLMTENVETARGLFTNAFKSLGVNVAVVVAVILISALLEKMGFENGLAVMLLPAIATVCIFFYILVLKPLGGLSALWVCRFNFGGAAGVVKESASFLVASSVAVIAESSIIGWVFLLFMRPAYFFVMLWHSVLCPPVFVLIYIFKSKRELKFLAKNKRAAESSLRMAA